MSDEAKKDGVERLYISGVYKHQDVTLQIASPEPHTSVGITVRDKSGQVIDVRSMKGDHIRSLTKCVLAHLKDIGEEIGKEQGDP